MCGNSFNLQKIVQRLREGLFSSGSSVKNVVYCEFLKPGVTVTMDYYQQLNNLYDTLKKNKPFTDQ